MSSSTKLLNVSFMVRVLRNREANDGFNSERAYQKDKTSRQTSEGVRKSFRFRKEKMVPTMFHEKKKKSKKASSPSSSPPSSGDDPEVICENSSFHFLLFLGGGSALGFTCLGRGFWLWRTEEGGAVNPSKVFT